MKKFLILFAILPLFTIAQNVGQQGDTLRNYTDINGNKQGFWDKKYTNGKTQYTGYFVDNKPVGEFKRYNQKGDLYALMVYDTKSDSITATFYHPGGQVAVTGKYFGKNKEGIWEYYSDSKKKYLTEAYHQNLKHGVFKQYTSDGIVIDETTWNMGIKHGSWRKYYVEGPLMFEGNFVNGLMQGESKSYYKSGKLQKQGRYEQDLMDGPWTIYKENGQIEKIYNFNKGVCPELADEQNKLLNEFEKNKDQFEDPALHLDDPEWFMRNMR